MKSYSTNKSTDNRVSQNSRRQRGGRLRDQQQKHNDSNRSSSSNNPVLTIFGIAIILAVIHIVYGSLIASLSSSADLSFLSLSFGPPSIAITNKSEKAAEQQHHQQKQQTKESTTTNTATSRRSSTSIDTASSSSSGAIDIDIDIDIISVGSQKELNLLNTQKETFGQHKTVRNFYEFTEHDDHEQNCYTDLTNSSWGFISDFCRSQPMGKYPELFRFRSRFANRMHIGKKGDAASGWLCAMKRPAESLYKVLKGYTTTTATATATATFINEERRRKLLRKEPNIKNDNNATTIPDYLFLLDADTYLNLGNIVGINKNEGGDGDGGGFLSKMYPPDSTLVIAGCMIKERIKHHNFTFPWGGFGTIFTKKSIQRFIQPIHNCRLDEGEGKDEYNNKINDERLLVDPKTNQSLKTMSYRELTDDEFERLVCSKLKDDMIGESFLFEEGMNVADLMYKYVTRWNYVNAEQNWGGQNTKTTGGFCLHADWVIGYFVNQYYLSNHDKNHFYKNNPSNRFLGYNGSEWYAGKQYPKNLATRKQCLNDYDSNCKPQTAHFCHHVSAAKMRELSSL